MIDEEEYKIDPRIVSALKQINPDTDLTDDEIAAIRKIVAILGSTLLKDLLNSEVQDG